MWRLPRIVNLQVGKRPAGMSSTHPIAPADAILSPFHTSTLCVGTVSSNSVLRGKSPSNAQRKTLSCKYWKCDGIVSITQNQLHQL